MGQNVVLKYVHAFKDRHGRQRYYLRIKGKRTRLPGEPGTPEFMRAYLRGLDGLPPEDAPKEVAPRSIADLVLRYYQTPAYAGLKAITRADYRRVLDRFAADHGHRSVAGLTAERIESIMGAMAERPGAAIYLFARIRKLMAYAVRLGWIPSDPTYRMAQPYKIKGHATWDEGHIAAFEMRWPVGTPQRLAFALALYTGQRRQSVHTMTWGDIEGDLIRVTQEKTNAKIKVPLHPDLRALLGATPKRGVAILLNQYGRAWTVKGFGNFMADAIEAAGLPKECVLHGLRKAAARRLAEAGATANEIAAVTGHKTLKEVEHYTRAADQERLARAGIGKLSAGLPNRAKSSTKSRAV